MFIKLIKINKNLNLTIWTMLILIVLGLFIQKIYFSNPLQVYSSNFVWNTISENTVDEKNKYIKWVSFTPTYEALCQTSKLDIDSHNNNSSIKYNWIELLSYLACKYGGNFKNFNSKDLDNLTQKLKDGTSMQNLTKDLKNYSYYFEAYDAVLHEYIGDYEIEITYSDTGEKSLKKIYGLKAFSPIANGYNYSHYDDFGNSRSYGYKRTHLGHDLMGSIGTPVIAVESGTIEALGWNQYGG